MKGAEAALREWLLSGSVPQPGNESEAEALIDAAERQGLAGQLEQAVATAWAAWPPGARQRLRRLQRELLARGLHQLELGARLLRALHARNLRVLPMKGLALLASRDVYRFESERPMADLDLLALSGFEAAAAVIEAEGLVLEERADHAWRYRHPDSRAAIELHHDVTSCPGLHPLDREGLWRRSHPCEALPRLPSREDLLLQLALHGAFQHGLRLSFAQWLDFRRLFETGRIDAARLAELTRAARAEASLFVALSAARSVVGADPPESLLAWAGERTTRGARRWISAQLRHPLGLAAVDDPLAAPLRARWMLAGTRRAALIARTLSPPGPGTPRSAARRAVSGLRRGLTLLWRWGVLARFATRPQPPAGSAATAGNRGA